MDHVAQKIEKAKTRLVVRHPWFGLLASRLKSEPSDEVEAFLSDGKVLQYNADWLATEPLETVEFMLANSVMHHVLAHENRQKGRQGWLWQLATDYAINDMLLQNGFKLPERVHYEARFAGKYAEEIYAALKEEIKNEEYGDDESAETGFNEQNKRRTKEQTPQENRSANPDDPPLPPMELDPEVEQMWASAAKEALERAQRQGKTPGGLERLFRRELEPTVDWRSELYQAIARHHKNDYTFAKPAKKWIASGIYLPSTYSETLIVTVAIDTSGSIDEALLGLFVAELESILLSFLDAEVDLLLCDAKIQGVYRFVSGEILDFPVKGGGGTDFRPVFWHIEKELPQTSLLIYFTDAQGSFPDEAPHYDVLWVMPEEAEVPFGRTIVFSEK